MTAFDLTIIVAEAPGHPELGPVLASLAATCTGLSTELIVVGVRAEPVPFVAPGVVARRILCTPDTLVPVQWGKGIAVAESPVVACLSTEFTVSSAWARTLLAALGGGSVGAATAISLAPEASATTTAMYLLRFAPFLPHPGQVAKPADNIPGDGAMYRRDQILAHPDLLAEGFWEIEFHRRWLATGECLSFDPGPLVAFRGPATLRDGVLLRYRHGATYGSTMVLRHSHSRMRHILLAPILPLVLTGRVARRAFSTKGFLRALPALLALTGAWSLGEAVGAIHPLQEAE